MAEALKNKPAFESPRARFLKTQAAAQFAPVAGSAMFDTAMDFAMLQFIDSQLATLQVHDAMASQYRLEGAKQFREILKKLPFPPEPRMPDRSGMLDEPK